KRIHAGLRQSSLAMLSGRFSMWMTIAATRIGNAVFTQTWTEQLPPAVRRIVFIAADVPCFAASAAHPSVKRYSVEYWQHGLQYRTLLIPPVDRIRALTAIEAR